MYLWLNWGHSTPSKYTDFRTSIMGLSMPVLPMFWAYNIWWTMRAWFFLHWSFFCGGSILCSVAIACSMVLNCNTVKYRYILSKSSSSFCSPKFFIFLHLFYMNITECFLHAWTTTKFLIEPILLNDFPSRDINADTAARVRIDSATPVFYLMQRAYDVFFVHTSQ